MSGSTAGTDIAITWNPLLGRGDWTMTDGALTMGNPLETAVLLSLFTDRVKDVDFVLTDGTTDPRGFWADVYEGFDLGSTLWELERVKITDRPALKLRIQGMCNDALQWLVDDGVAASVVTTATFLTPSIIGITIVITKPDGTKAPFVYQWAWQGVG
jgi:phage gp46-like protein